MRRVVVDGHMVKEKEVAYIHIASKMAEVKSRRVAQAEDLSNVEFETSEDVEVIPTFDNMNLREELLRGIYAYGKLLTYCLRFSMS